MQQIKSFPIHAISTPPSHHNNDTKKTQSAPLAPLLSFGHADTAATMQHLPMKRSVNGMCIVCDHALL